MKQKPLILGTAVGLMTFSLFNAECLEQNRAWTDLLGVIQKAHLVFPVQELFCSSAGCGTVQNKARDRGWALLNMSYSNMTFASSLSHSPSHSPSFQSAPPLSSHCASLLLSSPLAPPSSASSRSPRLLPPASSSCAVSTPCSRSPCSSCPGNGVRLGVPAHHYTARFVPEVSVTLVEMWMFQRMAGRAEGGYLAELV